MINDRNNKHIGIILLVLLIVIIAFPVFMHMEYMPIRMWDESVVAMNAVEMLHNHNYLVTYAYLSPDMWNCKPPLEVWCIVLCSKIFGFSELSIRLPSAMAAALLCVSLFLFLKKITGNYLFGFFTVCILVSSQGYIISHVVRTGEYDSLLVAFSTLFALCLFMAVDAGESKTQSKYIFAFFVFLTLAVLTKGVACMMQLPGLALYTFLRRKVVPLLKDKGFYAGLVLFLVIAPGFYLLRESVNPGYLKAVWDNELGGRFATVNEGHPGPITYYVNELAASQFTAFIFVLPVALLMGLKFVEGSIRKMVLFALVAGASFLLIISIAATKLPHYDAPLFPYLAIIAASIFYVIYTAVGNFLRNNMPAVASSIIAFTCVVALLAKPYSDIIGIVYFPKGVFWEESFSTKCRYFQHVANGKEPAGNYKLVLDFQAPFGENSVLKCYNEEMEERGFHFKYISPGQIVLADTAVVFFAGDRSVIEENYQTETIRHLDYCNADIIYVKKAKTEDKPDA